MSRISARLMVIFTLFILLTVPASAWHLGPPTDDKGDGTGEPTYKVGCTCHNNGADSPRIFIQVSGVPHVYNFSTSYELTITLTDTGGENTAGGFMLSTEGVGVFSWDEGEVIRPLKDSGELASNTSTSVGISQSDLTDPATWSFTWTAPDEDAGYVAFWLAGNIVDGAGAPDTTDYWNTMHFGIESETDAVWTGATQVIESTSNPDLLKQKDDSAAEEKARQEALSKEVMNNGATWFFISLIALIVGGLFQREILERRHGTGPAHLDKQLAYPEGLRRGILSVGLALLALYWLKYDGGAHLWGTAFFCSAWAAYGLYRTILAARTPPTHMDIM